ncbi:MAG TPA: transposase [Candidatus Acidoferrales bacterium]|nr:transposase [Candidatus Acidoferrales bacterium]
MPDFDRKNIRLPAGNYRGRKIYFVTLCFQNRRPIGSNPRIARWIIGQLRKHAANCEFFIHAYCVMPDHVHILAAAASESSNLIKFVEAFKQETAVRFERKMHRRLWQLKCYDRILRQGDLLDRVAWYIWTNPVRKGLCEKPTDYPFIGSFTSMGARLLKCAATAEWTPPWKSAALKTAALQPNLSGSPAQASQS